jgi:hypothetical protein
MAVLKRLSMNAAATNAVPRSVCCSISSMTACSALSWMTQVI